MDNNFYSDDFEQMLREKADEFKLQPSRRVWRSVYNSMHPSRKWPSVVISLLFITALVFVGYVNTNNDKNTLAEKKSPTDIRDNTNTAKTNAGNVVSKGIVNNSTAATNSIAAENLTANNVTALLFPDNTNTANAQNINNSQPGIINTNSNKNRNLQIEYAAVLSAKQTDLIIAEQSGKATSPGNNIDVENSKAVNSLDENNNDGIGIVTAAAQINTSVENKDALQVAGKDNKSSQAASKNITAENDRAWIDNFAFYNKSNRKKWKDRMSYEYYVTPGISYRSLKSNAKFNPLANAAQNPNNETYAINQIPALSAEIGGAMIYSFAKKLRFKAGLQFNYTSYGIKAYETNHPILTTLTLNDLNSGYSYLDSRNTSIANISGTGGTTLHNKTYQVSLPVGLEVKLAGKERLQWYAGATVQPTYIIGGKSYLLSSDNKNYVADNSMIRKWSFNTGIETFISFKTNHGTTLQIGPQVRFQVPSTYGKKYSMDEKLFSAGLKLGVVRNF